MTKWKLVKDASLTFFKIYFKEPLGSGSVEHAEDNSGSGPCLSKFPQTRNAYYVNLQRRRQRLTVEAGAPALSTSSIPVVEHTARAPGALPSPSPSTALPTPAGDGHGRRLYVAPPAVGIAASPGGYMPHPEHPDFFPIELVSTHRRRPLIIRAYT